MVLILKIGGGYRGIGLVEVIWKVCISIINIRLQKNITPYDALHGLRHGKGTGKASMEEKLTQQLTVIVHEPLLQVFINMPKSYESLDRGRCMEILRGYGLGPNLQRLIQRFWDRQKMVPKSGKYFGRPFCTERGVTQGDPVSPTIFNIVVIEVVRAVILEVYGPQESHHGIGWSAGKHNIFFYADDGRITGRYLLWMQTTLLATERTLERACLQKNLGNTKEMACKPGFIWGQQGAAAYKRRATGEGANF